MVSAQIAPPVGASTGVWIRGIRSVAAALLGRRDPNPVSWNRAVHSPVYFKGVRLDIFLNIVPGAFNFGPFSCIPICGYSVHSYCAADI